MPKCKKHYAEWPMLVYRFPLHLDKENESLLEGKFELATEFYKELVRSINSKLYDWDSRYRDCNPEYVDCIELYNSVWFGRLMPSEEEAKDEHLKDYKLRVDAERKRVLPDGYLKYRNTNPVKYENGAVSKGRASEASAALSSAFTAVNTDTRYRNLLWKTKNSIKAAVVASIEKKLLFKYSEFLNESRKWSQIGGQTTQKSFVPMNNIREVLFSPHKHTNAAGRTYSNWERFTYSDGVNAPSLSGLVQRYRELPTDSIIGYVYISKGDHPTRKRYYLSFTVRSQMFPKKPELGSTVVGFDGGWAQDGSDIIAGAFSVGDTAYLPTVTVLYEALTKADSIISSNSKDKSIDLRQARATVRNAVNSRNAEYAKLARLLRDKYGAGVLAIEDVKTMAGASKLGGKQTRRQRSIAAMSIVRTIFKKEGFSILEVPAKNTSNTCSQCGNIDKSSRNGREYSCSQCGACMHADVNAAKNIERLGEIENHSPSRTNDYPSNIEYLPLCTSEISRRKNRLYNRSKGRRSKIAC